MTNLKSQLNMTKFLPSLIVSIHFIREMCVDVMIILGTNDIEDITEILKDVHHKWYEMGVALKIPTSTLDRIIGEASDTKQCFEVSALPCNASLISFTSNYCAEDD